MASNVDVHISDDVSHALSTGMGESTIESQHVRAIAVLTATVGLNAAQNAALAAAISLLNKSLAHIRDPHGH